MPALLQRFLPFPQDRTYRRRRPGFVRLSIEALEDRTLLSGSIFGNVFNDLSGDGIRQAGEPALASQVAYLDPAVTTVTKSPVAPATNLTLTDVSTSVGVPAFISKFDVANLPAQVQDVAVNMNLSNNSSGPVSVVLLSPTGLAKVLGTGSLLSLPQGAYVFTIQPGQSFANITIDGNTSPSVNAAATLVDGNTYGPQESFTTPNTFIDTVNPNGTWGLLFLTPDQLSTDVSLHSWSLAFTPQGRGPSTLTDALGNYSFTNVAPGTNRVSLVVPAGEVAPRGASQSVVVVDGQVTNGVNFGLQPIPTSVSSTNVPVTSGTVAQQAPSIAVDPNDPNHLVTAYMDFSHHNNNGYAGIGIAVSHDGGISWPTSSVTSVTLPTNFTQGAAAPTVAFDAQGNVYVAFMAVTYLGATQPSLTNADTSQRAFGFQSNNGIFVAKSSDGGLSWSQCAAVAPHLYTGNSPADPTLDPAAVPYDAFPQLAIDTSRTSPTLGSMYVTWTRFYPGKAATLANQYPGGDPATNKGGSDVMIAVNTNDGTGWTPQTGATAQLSNRDYAVTAAADGTPLQVALNATGGFTGTLKVRVLNEDDPLHPFVVGGGSNQHVLSSATVVFTLPSITAGHKVYVRVSSEAMQAGETASYSITGTQGEGTISDSRTVSVPPSAIRDPFFGLVSNGAANPVADGFVKFSWVTVGAGGAVYVSTDAGGSFTVYASKDGGVSFTTPSTPQGAGNYLGNPFDYTQTGVLPNGTLDNFRTFRTREIAADPTRPGVLYAIAPSSLATAQAQPNNLAAANGIVFAVSTDYGQSWSTNFTVGAESSPFASLTPDQINAGFMPVLNDDNGGQYPGFAPSLQNQVVSNFAFPSISVSPQGSVSVIWYDTRTDPSGQKIQVWGTSSNDGGQHFSANFPVSNTSFDPSAAVPAGSLGDQIGIAASSTGAHVVWTDTRNGSQQIFSGTIPFNPLPAAPVDRFAPNFTLLTATDLGQVTAAEIIPRLNLLPGQGNEWFSLTAGASGGVIVKVSAASANSSFQVVLTDVAGNAVQGAVISDVTDASNVVIGKQILAPSVSGARYFIHVSGTSDSGIGYTLNVSTLTADLGSPVEGTQSGTIAAGGQDIFRLAAAVTGTLQFHLTGLNLQGSGLSLQVLAADGHTVLAATPVSAAVDVDGTPAEFRLAVTQGEVVLLAVSAVDATSAGDFTLQFTNFDQFEIHGAQVEGAINDAIVVPPSALGSQNYPVTASLDGTPLIVNFAATGGYAGHLKVRVVNLAGTQRFGSNQFAVSDGSPLRFDLTGLVTPGQTVDVRVSEDIFHPQSPGDEVDYTLSGTQVEGATSYTNSLPALPAKNYSVTASVNGTLQVTLNASGSYSGTLKVRILNPAGTFRYGSNQFVAAPVSGGPPNSIRFTVPSVTAGQSFLIRVSGLGVADGDEADYTIDVTNFDPTAVSGVSNLFFPTVGDPSSLAVADLRNNGKLDLLASFNTASDSVNVLTGNGNGTFQPAKQFAVGPGLSSGLTPGDRQLAVANLISSSNIPDVIVPNFRGADVSVLLGNGDQTFKPERRFDAVASPTSLVTGDFNSDSKTDVAVIQSFTQGGQNGSHLAILTGRGDGTFLPPVLYPTVFTGGAGPMVVGDFNGDGHPDIIVFSKNEAIGQIFLGQGGGTFHDGGTFTTGENTFNAQAIDLNGDGHLDLVTTGANTGNVYVMLGTGDGTFPSTQTLHAMTPRTGENVTINGLTVVDFGSVAGPADGHPDIIVTGVSRSGGAAEVIMLPGLVDGSNHFAGFGGPVVLATVGIAGDVVAGDFGNGATDLAVADKGGIRVIYGTPLTLTPNSTPAHARIWGDAVHLLTHPQAIVTGFTDAYYTYTVPTEATAGAGDQIVDISALFQNTTLAGLTLDVTGAIRVLQSATDNAAGTRLRVIAHQGATLTIHVSSNAGGFGVYTLAVDVLPQVVRVEAQSPIPGGALTSLVVTLQGDHLDPASAADPANYVVFQLAVDGVTPVGAAIPLSTLQPIVYAPGANVEEIAHGRTFPEAARQTLTLLFDQPLIGGASYRVQLSPLIQAAALNPLEPTLLAGGQMFVGHPVVRLDGTDLRYGGSIVAAPIVQPGNLDQLANGTAFLTQLHTNLSAQLDSLLSRTGDNPGVSAALTNQILASFVPGWLAGANRSSFLILWLDPVSIQLADPRPTPTTTTFNQQTNTVSNDISRTFLEVGGSVEIMVVAAISGTYTLNVNDVQASARGGAVLLDGDQIKTVAITEAMRGGEQQFQFVFGQNLTTSTVSSGALTSSHEAILTEFSNAVAVVAQNLLREPVVLETIVAIAFQLQASTELPGQALGTATSGGAAPDVAQTMARLVQTFMQDFTPENLLDGVQMLPLPGYLRNWLNRPNRPAPPPEDEMEQMSAEPEIEGAMVLTDPPAEEAVRNAEPSATALPAREPTERLNGLLVALLLAAGGGLVRFSASQEEEPEAPGLQKKKAQHPQ